MFSSNTSQVSQDAVFIEDVMSTYLYTGNSSTQTITNGIDLAGKGGLVWIKRRTTSAAQHNLTDTARGAGVILQTDTTSAQITTSTSVNTFNANGFFLNSNASAVNLNGEGYASWTFRKQPKFFDVVTWTGDGVQGRVLSHSLGSTPGFILIKETSTTGNWKVWHRGDGTTNYTAMSLNLTDAWPGSSLSSANLPTSTTFQPAWIYASDYSNGNANGVSYVAYLFAHNAGGFGLTGTDNVISCGSFTIGGSGNATVDLGFEPQWVMTKATDVAGNWRIADVMRGMTANGTDAVLNANLSNAEASANLQVAPTATGFQVSGGLPYSATYIYIAIRRGPMKTPTSGTSVFSPIYSNLAIGQTNTTNFPVDTQLMKATAITSSWFAVDRLRGVSSNSTESGAYLLTNSVSVEATVNAPTLKWDNVSFQTSSYTSNNWGQTLFLNFKRAPGFHDVVCYTGNGANRTINHNLGVVPELIIVKNRADTVNWLVYNSAVGNTKYMILNSGAAPSTSSGAWNNTMPTASVFTVGTFADVNESGFGIVAYLFASCPGVSKVGSYTGDGGTQTINCGFTGGARFIMIKRTDAAGAWYVWDSARGIGVGNDPSLVLNGTNAQSPDYDSINADSSGFQVNQNSGQNINVSGATYIYLAIA